MAGGDHRGHDDGRHWDRSGGQHRSSYRDHSPDRNRRRDDRDRYQRRERDSGWSARRRSRSPRPRSRSRSPPRGYRPRSPLPRRSPPPSLRRSRSPKPRPSPSRIRSSSPSEPKMREWGKPSAIESEASVSKTNAKYSEHGANLASDTSPKVLPADFEMGEDVDRVKPPIHPSRLNRAPTPPRRSTKTATWGSPPPESAPPPPVQKSSRALSNSPPPPNKSRSREPSPGHRAPTGLDQTGNVLSSRDDIERSARPALNTSHSSGRPHSAIPTGPRRGSMMHSPSNEVPPRAPTGRYGPSSGAFAASSAQTIVSPILARADFTTQQQHLRALGTSSPLTSLYTPPPLPSSAQPPPPAAPPGLMADSANFSVNQSRDSGSFGIRPARTLPTLTPKQDAEVAGVRAYRFGTLLANDLRAETAVTRAMFELKKVELEVCYAKETTRVAEVQLELFGGGAGVGLGVLTGVLAGQHSSSLLV